MTKKKGRVQDRTAIVTGSSRGIGKAIAILLAKEGAKIVVNYNNSDKAAQEIVKNIEQIGSKALVIKADVSKKTEVEYMIKETLSEFGSIDILVNNAGVAMGEAYFKTLLKQILTLCGG